MTKELNSPKAQEENAARELEERRKDEEQPVTTNGSSKESPVEAAAETVKPPTADHIEEGEITDVSHHVWVEFGIKPLYYFVINEIQII